MVPITFRGSLLRNEKTFDDPFYKEVFFTRERREENGRNGSKLSSSATPKL
jgi:hypothetical protein